MEGVVVSTNSAQECDGVRRGQRNQGRGVGAIGQDRLIAREASRGDRMDTTLFPGFEHGSATTDADVRIACVQEEAPDRLLAEVLPFFTSGVRT
jgi:hypothetical protein